MKIKHLLTISLIALLALTGCASKSTKIPSQPIQTNDNIIENSYVKPDYSITEIDGKCYMNFSDGNTWNYTDTVTGQETATIEFESIAQMKYAIENDTFEKEDIYKIKKVFNKNSVNGIEIINTNKLYKPSMSLDFTYNHISWDGNSYDCVIKTNIFSECVFTYLSEEGYNEYFNRRYNDIFVNENINLTSEEKQNISGLDATIYEYNTSIVKYREIRYDIKNNDKILRVQEEYILESKDSYFNCSESIPYFVYVYGYEKGEYFAYMLSDFNTPTSIDWISSLGIEPYID